MKVGGGTLKRPASSTQVPYSMPYIASRTKIPAAIAVLIQPHTVPNMGKVLHTAVLETAIGRDAEESQSPLERIQSNSDGPWGGFGSVTAQIPVSVATT